MMMADEKKSSRSARLALWRHRIIYSAMLALLVLIIVRIFVSLLFPIVLGRVVGHYGLSAHYDRLELNMLGTDAGIWYLTLTPKTGGDPIFQSNYLRCDIATLDLFRGKLTIRRLEAEKILVLLERKA